MDYFAEFECVPYYVRIPELISKGMVAMVLPAVQIIRRDGPRFKVSSRLGRSFFNSATEAASFTKELPLSHVLKIAETSEKPPQQSLKGLNVRNRFLWFVWTSFK